MYCLEYIAKLSISIMVAGADPAEREFKHTVEAGDWGHNPPQSENSRYIIITKCPHAQQQHISDVWWVQPLSRHAWVVLSCEVMK